MKSFVAYSIPIQGLKNGIHQLHYSADADFFHHFEDSPINEANLDIHVQFDKRPDMFLLDFSLTGTVKTVCDRCTADIDMPVFDERQLIVKYGEAEGEDEDEVVFINREDAAFNFAQYIYEFSVLALPITNVYACTEEAEPPCNADVLKYLKSEEESTTRSIWDALKDINN